MSHTGISGVLGPSMSNAIGVPNANSFSQQAAQQYNTIMLQQQAQIQQAQIANLGKHYNANIQTYEWVWNGRPVSITEFAELAYGDTSQKTMFLLKHSDKKEN